MEQLIVRPATEADLPGVSEVRVRSWQAGYAGLLPDALLDGMSVAQDIARRREFFAERPTVFETLVADLAGTVVGFAILGPYRIDHGAAMHESPLSEDEGEIYALYVSPDRWRSGTGRALIHASLDRLAERGLTPVKLWVLAGNTRARRFYEAAGFTADGERGTFDIGDAQAAEVRYARPA